jgi:hypothetical protein
MRSLTTHQWLEITKHKRWRLFEIVITVWCHVCSFESFHESRIPAQIHFPNSSQLLLVRDTLGTTALASGAPESGTLQLWGTATTRSFYSIRKDQWCHLRKKSGWIPGKGALCVWDQDSEFCQSPVQIPPKTRGRIELEGLDSGTLGLDQGWGTHGLKATCSLLGP